VFDFFFYGTLVDADVRQLVLGRAVPDDAVLRAELPGFRRYSVQGQSYPAAVPQTDASTDGVVMENVGVSDAAMLSCFEGVNYEARLCRVTVQDGDVQTREAWIFVAGDNIPRANSGWSIGEWRAQHKPAFVELAKSWLDSISADDISAAERMWRERLAATEPR
jgi:Gamma-glutamyl cyclotransferase, AIG2-like